MPFPPAAVRSASPKLDPSEVYLKSKTLFEDKREYTDLLHITPKLMEVLSNL